VENWSQLNKFKRFYQNYKILGYGSENSLGR
jgi:hypothetical protein